MTLQEFYTLLLADIAKAPTLLADVNQLKTDAEKLLTDAGLPVPWAGLAVAHDATTVQLESQITARKLGDGTILKGIGQFLQSPLGQALLQLLLGSLKRGGTTTP